MAQKAYKYSAQYRIIYILSSFLVHFLYCFIYPVLTRYEHSCCTRHFHQVPFYVKSYIQRPPPLPSYTHTHTRSNTQVSIGTNMADIYFKMAGWVLKFPGRTRNKTRLDSSLILSSVKNLIQSFRGFFPPRPIRFATPAAAGSLFTFSSCHHEFLSGVYIQEAETKDEAYTAHK